MPRPKTILVALVAALLPALTGAAGAADGDPYVKSCHATASSAPCTQLQPPFMGVDAELAPDGRHLYAVIWQNGGGSNGLRQFDVGAGAALTPRDLTAVAGQGYDVDFSPDGRQVYLSAGGQFVVFGRVETSGALTQLQCFGAPPCQATTGGLHDFASAAVSSDGRSVYVRGTNLVTVFDRDPSAGTLTQKPLGAGCVVEELTAANCSGAVGIAGFSSELTVSPDGRHLYVSNQTPGGVAVFSRQADGSLSQLPGTQGGCLTVGGSSGASGGTECSSAAPTVSQAWAANIDRQGEFVIVSATGGNTVFRRDSATGSLTQTDCLDELGGGPPPVGCHEAKGATGSDAAVSADGRSVVLNADFGLSAFSFDRPTGKLAQRATRGCFSAAAGAPCQQVPGLLGGLGSVTFSNGLSLFSAHRGGSVAAFEVDAAPACQGKSVSVPRNTTVFISLVCTDANGDKVAFQIAAPPANGSLGVVNQTRKRVSYKPEINYRGRDVFQFRGTARGTRGTPAIVRITVLKRGKLIDRRPPNTRIKSGPAKTTHSRTALFRFTSTERRSRFECKLDRARWARCKTPKRYTALKLGRHSFRVRATDRAGNTDLSPAKRSWIRRR